MDCMWDIRCKKHTRRALGIGASMTRQDPDFSLYFSIISSRSCTPFVSCIRKQEYRDSVGS